MPTSHSQESSLRHTPEFFKRVAKVRGNQIQLQRLFWPLLSMIFLTSFSATARATEQVTKVGVESPVSEEHADFFEKQIRPLLIKHCHECHGPDEQSGGLRLDSQSALRKGGDSGPVLRQGKPEESRLILGVNYNDVNFQMPPDGKLSGEEIAALETWVKLDAPWPAEANPATDMASSKPVSPAARIDEIREKHWAYQAVTKPPLPVVQDQSWVQNPIDQFVLAKLENAGLKPNPPANRRTLIRRLYFDLIGLPPSYQEVESFVADNSPEAVPKIIDRLLANPHYGERWGRHWLDIARYSDTMGYMGVAAETRYPYAYTYRDWVIDAFNKDKPYNRFVMEQIAADQLDLSEEQQADLAAMGFLNVGRRFNNRIHEIIDDQIDVVSRGFLGLSVTCARCHDHKFDPIPTADYYSLYGVFASSQEPEQFPIIGEIPKTPESKSFQQGLATRQKKLTDWLESLRVKIEQELRARSSDYLVYEARVLQQYDTGKVKQQGKSGYMRPAAIKRWHAFLAEREAEQSGIWHLWHQLARLPSNGFAEQSQALLNDLIAADAEPENASKTDLKLARLTPATKLVIAALQKAPFAKSMPEVADRFGSVLQQTHTQWETARKKNPQTKQLPQAANEELRQELFRAGSPLVLASTDTAAHRTQKERGENRKLEKEVRAFEFSHPGAPPRAMVLEDKPQLVNPVIFRRGLPANRGENVPRRFLHVLSHIDGGNPFVQGSGRLELANAIANEKNPLTPRVIVNRIWQHHFGEGLVRTPSNFGERGEKPTHPELLDYLAATFIENGWSIKQLHRTILLSSAWQQSSHQQPAAALQDPENRLLWKMNRRRLEFEPFRDALLLTSGKLDLQIGGRSVNIHQGAPRRGLYAFVDREDIPGLLAAFDLPNPDATTAVRSETTVPQQALYLMNSPLILEQARSLAARTSSEQTPVARLKKMVQLTFARDASAEELALAEQFLSPKPEPAATKAKPSTWQVGSGRYNSKSQKLENFKPFAHFTGQYLQPTTRSPDPTWHYLKISAQHGHPGISDDYAVVRRWVAPQAGEVKIQGSLKHPSDKGNGVQAWIISSRSGELGSWTVQHNESPINIEKLTITKGETLDFVVAPRGDHSYDSFSWAPVITLSKSTNSTKTATNEAASIKASNETVWDAAADFTNTVGQKKHQSSVDPWVQLAQVFLLSNEFIFVD